MTSNYKLVGLERLNNSDYMSATIERFDKEETFKAYIGGDNKFKDAIWNYCQHNWGNLKAIVIHNGTYNSPIDAIIHKVEHIN